MDGGEIVRRLHWRAWRSGGAADADMGALMPAPEVSPAELLSVLPLLIESGSVGVVWPRLRDRFGGDSAVGRALEAAYASQLAHNARVEGEIARVVGRLHDAGIQPVLIKGLAVARLYPSPLVRPAGDIDLVVRDEQYDLAREVLAAERLSFHGDPAARRAHAERWADAEKEPREADLYSDVDLHAGSRWYGSQGNARFFEDAEITTIAGQRVHLPCVEDHLRAMCLHLLRHGAVRPVRFCDVALLLESGYGGDHRSRGEDRPYDWSRILSGNARQAEQAAVTLRLAEELLGARLDGAPEDVRRRQLPRWLVLTVLQTWGRPAPTHRTAGSEFLANPRDVLGILRRRWPDPLVATVRVGARFDEVPRWPIQVAAYAKHAALYVARTLHTLD